MGCDIHLFVEKKVNGKWEHVQGEFYDDRNYDLFAILADVRNGHGFAGCITGEGFVPISDPKGIPDDCSDEIIGESDGWGVDGHSHSWLTVKELLNYDWDQQTYKIGYVDPKQYAEFVKSGKKPTSWCGYTSIADHRQIKWPIKYRDRASDFIDNVIPKFLALGNPDDVRIVFWFDN